MTRDTDEQLKDVLREAKILAVRYCAITGKQLGVTGEIAEYEVYKQITIEASD